MENKRSQIDDHQVIDSRHLDCEKPYSAFTLLEVLLVMVVIVIVSSIAILNMRHAFANTRLQKGAESIRAEFARARIKAIKSGQTQVFRHLVGDNGYVTTPHSTIEDLVESDSRYVDAASLGWDTEGGSTADANAGLLNGMGGKIERLPDGVYFMGSDVSMDARAESRLSNYPELNATASGGAAVGTGGGGWGVPVFFFPDGSTTTARMVLANQKGFALSVELRGLTGIARVGTMRSSNEIVPLGVSQ
ncbi:MAG: prepilin-type N-terminal cleavage/methylation domain-containing protein [Planctomycetales bacterium]|nr:prepilin-type N-terminal cleavage/methylation domain-containing protein [Planctomycetales bacterium]